MVALESACYSSGVRFGMLGWLGAAVIATAASGCGGKQLVREGVFELTFGLEPSVWSGTSEALGTNVHRITADGSSELHLELDGPVDAFPMGRGVPAAFEVDIGDGETDPVARTRSLELDPVAFIGSRLPLFLGRTGTFARPGELNDEHGRHPPVAVIARRFLLAAGASNGDELRLDFYDLARWDTVPNPPVVTCASPPCTYGSVAAVGPDENLVLLIGGDAATWLDLDQLVSGPATLPSGLTSFSAVDGGRTISGPDGVRYVVGPTRQGDATDAVLRISPDGELAALITAAPRRQAAAAWIDGRGLVIAGGTSTGPGAEILTQGTEVFDALPFAPDATTGAALAVLDARTVLRVGGKTEAGASAPSVTLDLTCNADCQPTARGDPLDLDRVMVFETAAGTLLATGVLDSGETRAFRFSPDGPRTAIDLREPRAGAASLLLPTGHVALVGGETAAGPVLSLELFTP